MTIARILTTLCAAFALTAAMTGASLAGSRDDIKEIIVEEALATTLPPSLALAVAKVESDFQVRALSPRGARGVMQIMPETAEEEFGVTVEELWDARLNVRLGVDVLARLVKRYDGRWDLSLSHYNGGRVVGTGDQATPLPSTRKYIASVLRWQKHYADQAKVWNAAPADPSATTRVSPDQRPPVPRADNLDDFSGSIEQRLRQIRPLLDDFAAANKSGER